MLQLLMCLVSNRDDAELLNKLKNPPPLIRPSVSKGSAVPEIIDTMRQCWSELPDNRPNFNTIYDTFKKLNLGKYLRTSLEILD